MFARERNGLAEIGKLELWRVKIVKESSALDAEDGESNVIRDNVRYSAARVLICVDGLHHLAIH